MDIVWVTDGFWDDVHRLRHKMALALGTAGHRVLWVEHPLTPRRVTASRLRQASQRHPHQVGDNVWRCSPGISPPGIESDGKRGLVARKIQAPLMVRKIRSALTALNMACEVLVLMQAFSREDLLNRLRPRVSVYYACDLPGYETSQARHRRLEAKVVQAVDQVVVTSQAQADRLAFLRKDVTVLPHAVSDEAFLVQKGEPMALRPISRPRAIFAGPVSGKIDVPSLNALLDARRDLQLIFLGSGNLPPGLRRHNVHLLPRVRSAEVPQYLRAVDALLLPYKCNLQSVAMTGMRSLKFFEYLAAGTPVATTRFAQAETDMELVQVAEDTTPVAFVRATERALAERGDTGRADARIALARLNSYAERLAVLERLWEPSAALRSSE